MTFSDLTFDAFRSTNATSAGFQEAAPCPVDKPNDLIPIIVGCVLAAMVVVVLVAYLIGRRYRSNTPYEEME